MDRTLDATARGRAAARPRDAIWQAYQILHWAFVLVPTIAGLDKFFHALTNWDQYLAPSVEKILPFSGHTFMLIVGAIELFAAFLVLVKPRVGAWVVAAWLAGIVVNFLVLGGFYDIAARDFGLMLGALALARLSSVYDPPLEHAS